ncbi:uncharacterized protein LOC134837476 [Culicoides brevitarsis]|uniref:uncharacterized protein LOC134837476 n=1 Tax=Culicoides brevitarsis TaxID=469753 RepID=UPI00307B3151
MGINNNEIDDEEEKADQIRRNLELAQNLDKYLDIEDESVDQLETSVEFLNRSNDIELSRLKDILLAKSTELETLKELLTKEAEEKLSLLNDFQKKIRILEAEKDRTIMSKNQIHDLLVESKTEVSTLQSNVHELMEKLKNSETISSNLTIELKQTKTLLSNLQCEYNTQHEMKHKHTTSYVESTIKRHQEKYSVQLDIMQQQIDSLSSKLNDKECEIQILNNQNKDLEYSRKALSEEINNLKKSSEEKQTFTSHNSLIDENTLLQKSNKDLIQQNHILKNEILELQKRLNKNLIFDVENNEKRCQEEIQKLKVELEKKNEDLQHFKALENKYMIEENEFKKSKKRLEYQVLQLEENDSPYLAELRDLQSKNLEMNNAIENYKKETDCLRKDLQKSKDTVAQLEKKIALQESQNDLISELKQKANQFEIFMKSSGEKALVSKTVEKESDLKVIQDMTQKYAMEVKIIENKCKDQIQSYTKSHQHSLKNIEKLKMCLQVKCDEIQSLKTMALRERAKINEIIMYIENRAKNILGHQTEVIKKCKLELQLHQKELENLKNIQYKKNQEYISSEDKVQSTTLNNIIRIKEKYQLAKLTAQQYKYGSLKKEQYIHCKNNALNEFHANLVLKLEKPKSIDSEYIYMQVENLKYNQNIFGIES